MYHAGQPLDAIIPDLISKLAVVRDKFDETARRVRELVADCPPKVHKDLDQHIDGLRTIATGTIEWRYRCPVSGLSFSYSFFLSPPLPLIFFLPLETSVV